MKTRRNPWLVRLRSLLSRGPATFANAVMRRARIRLAPDLFWGEDGYALPPAVVTFEVTHRCNLRCAMCDLYGGDTPPPLARGRREKDEDLLTLGEFERILSQLTRARPVVAFTGGEPLLAGRLPDRVAAATRMGFPTVLTTNGTALERFADELVTARLGTLVLSLDGPRHVHDALRGVPGTFDRAIRGLRAVLAARRRRHRSLPRVQINTTITGATAATLPTVARIALDEGVPRIVYSHLWFWTREAADTHNRLHGELCRTEPQNLGGLDGLDPVALAARVEETRRMDIPVLRQFLPDLDAERIRRYYEEPTTNVGPSVCRSPWVTLRVLPDGQALPCLDCHVGDLRRESLSAVWNGPRFRRFRRRLLRGGLFPACMRCCGLFSY